MTTVLVTHPTDKVGQYFGRNATDALRAIADLRFNVHARDLTTDELVEAAQGCDAIIAYRQTPAPAALFSQLPELAAFIRCAVDIRTVDVAAASAHGVLVTQASAGFMAAVSEWIIGAMIDLARGTSQYAAGYRRDEPLAPFMGRELRASTLGVIGYGQIAQYLCPLAQALGMQVLVTAPDAIEAQHKVRQAPLQTLLGDSDFVVCLAPATPQTEKLMNAEAFMAMRPGSFFINASRGELVDDAALLRALDDGHIAGCALDVGRAPDQMPMPELARHPRVLATPHIGGLTLPAIEHQALETVAQLAALQRGEMPQGAVNAAHATRVKAWKQASVIR